MRVSAIVRLCLVPLKILTKGFLHDFVEGATGIDSEALAAADEILAEFVAAVDANRPVFVRLCDCAIVRNRVTIARWLCGL